MLVVTVHEALLVELVLMVVPVLVVSQVPKVQLVVRVTAVPQVKEVSQVTLPVQSLCHTKHKEKKVFQVHPDNLVLTVRKVVQAHKVLPVHVVNLVSVVGKVQMVDVVQPVHLDLLVVADPPVHKVLKVPPVLPDVVLKTSLTSENIKECFIRLNYEKLEYFRPIRSVKIEKEMLRVELEELVSSVTYINGRFSGDELAVLIVRQMSAVMATQLNIVCAPGYEAYGSNKQCKSPRSKNSS